MTWSSHTGVWQPELTQIQASGTSLCCGLKGCIPPNSYGKTQVPEVTVFGADWDALISVIWFFPMSRRKHTHTLRPTIPLLGLANRNTHLCLPEDVLIPAPCRIVPNRKLLKCLSTAKWINKFTQRDTKEQQKGTNYNCTRQSGWSSDTECWVKEATHKGKQTMIPSISNANIGKLMSGQIVVILVGDGGREWLDRSTRGGR